jgi:hypothetical protein
MSCSESANVLVGVVRILRTSSGPTFDAHHAAIDTAHPQVVDGCDQANVGRMIAKCGPPRFCSSGERLLSAHLARSVGADERPFTEPTAAARPWRREPLTLRANARHRARIGILGGEQLVHHAQPRSARAVRVEDPDVAVGPLALDRHGGRQPCREDKVALLAAGRIG